MFGSLSSAQQIIVALSLKGGPEYAAQMEAASVETNAFGRALLRTAAAQRDATKNSWLHNQALYTARRYAFYATLAVTALAGEVMRLGIGYLNTVQTAKVALRGIFPTQNALEGVISRLYKMSTLSPFLFKDTLTAFRTMYPAFHAVGISANTTLRTLQGAMNALAESGRTGIGSLTRISVQLQHLANIGRPTGQILLALARDGLPVYPALRKELGLTGTSLENLATSGLTAVQVMNALTKYETQVAPFQGAAFRLATRTLQGNWQMFKDILAQASGHAEGGLFSGLTSDLRGINEYLAPLFRANKPIGLYNIATAIDSVLTPRTHLLINLFIAFDTALRTTFTLLGMVAWGISLALRPLDYLFNLFGFSSFAAKLFGTAVGIIVSLLVIEKSLLFLNAVALDAWKFAVRGAMLAAKLLAWSLRFDLETALIKLMYIQDAVAAQATIMWDALMGPVGWTILLITALTIMYIKWRAFHDAVNSTVLFLWHNPLADVFIPLVGQLIILARVLDEIYNTGSRIANIVQHPIRAIQHGVPNLAHSAASSATNWRNYVPYGNFIPRFATGGTMSRAGYAMVGENGPEILHLPGGSKVEPLGRNALNGTGTLAIHVYPQDIYLDRTKIATVIATAVTDKEARS